ncbi:hypothetical protein EXIGLDRAFT_735028 [Exidia glandulosa HHB12029]|uniref:WSC domain-containing protein n=1 Tax=Exidia glandulosa HHB12029 TaxID=1314781 RepID=A0A165K0Z2_EXIGL|nr:hypothetical protein EXIGLDRAFT_735028 [Exidia glandulosa HHB12029]
MGAPLALSLVLIVCAQYAAAFFRMTCGRPVTVMRADPIVNPGAVSNHVHQVLGGNAFDFTQTYDSLRASSCSSCAARQDLSVYWTPNLWYHAKNGSFHPVNQITATVYYLQRYGSNGERLRAFPKGFRMLAGDMTLRSFDQDDPAQKAVTFNCLDAGNTGAAGQYNRLPTHNCPSGMRTQIFFPSCWDGQSLDSPNHKTHVAYPSGVDSGTCPSTHPIRLISIFYEIVYDTGSWNDMWWDGGSSDIGQPFILSMGDPVGYGFHGDFINGWDVDLLQKVVDECTADSGVIEECGPLASDLRSVDEMNDCAFPGRVPEPVTGWLPELPGCNPVQPGPTAAVINTTCGAPQSTDFVPRASVSFIADTNVSQWESLGCAHEPKDGRILTQLWTGANATAMGVDKCVQHCKDSRWRYAGLENGNECWCGTSLSSPATQLIGPYTCDTPCAGGGSIANGTLPENCGAQGKLAIYKDIGAPAPTLGKPRCRLRRKPNLFEQLMMNQRVLAMPTSPARRR